MKRFLAILALTLVFFSGTAYSAQVEDALTKCPEKSVYGVLKLNDTGAFLKWLFSRENIDNFMPLILASDNSNEIIGAIEIVSAVAENTPLASSAALLYSNGAKDDISFQFVFTAQAEAAPIVKRISDGTATASDIAKLFLGINNPLASFAESMIKVEDAGDKILRIDNAFFMKAQDGMIITGASAEDVKNSLKALDEASLRLFGKDSESYNRRFSAKDFVYFHIDPATLSKLVDDTDSDDLELFTEYFDKPLNYEAAFNKMSDKFIISIAVNVKESMKKFYVDKFFANSDKITKVKGGHLKPAGIKSPLMMFSGFLDLSTLKDSHPEAVTLWKEITKQLKNRFGISEQDAAEALKGNFSLTVNDNVTSEGFKIPAIYSYTEGKIQKIFSAISKSPHFHKVQEGVFQIDSSVSPVSCIVEDKDGSLGVHFADLASINGKPEIKSGLEDLMNKEAISAFWLDFEAIRSWIVAPENGILIMLEPIARFTGNGEIFDIFKDFLNAEFSVPSLSVWAESQEVGHIQFNTAEIDPSNGILKKIVSISRKYLSTIKSSNEPEGKK